MVHMTQKDKPWIKKGFKFRQNKQRSCKSSARKGLNIVHDGCRQALALFKTKN
jgi:hypothetical protein